MPISFVNPVLPSRFENVTSFSNRNTEIKKIISIMSKRQNRSVLIWGEPGVGKSGLIDMLTWNITLQYDGYSFWELDLTGLISQSKENIHTIFLELASMLQKNLNNVLIINNLEYISDYNFQAELMKLLSIPSICILATVDTIEADISYKQLYNMFFQINLTDPTASETAEMIKQQVSDIAKYHEVTISNELIKWLVYVSEFCFSVSQPKRSVDLIDTVMAHAKLSGHSNVTKEDFFDFFGSDFQKFCHLSAKQKRYTGIHELGHFIVHLDAESTLGLSPCLISIIPKGTLEGFTSIETIQSFTPAYDRQYYIQNIASSLAGKIAEEIFDVPVNAGSSLDLVESNELAEEFASKVGMNSKLNDRIFDDEDLSSLDEDTLSSINEGVDSILEEARNYAESIILKNKDIIEAILPHLTENGILTRPEIDEIISQNHSLDN